MELNEKQKKFADAFIKCGNASEAAITAGYNKKNCATNTNKLLNNMKVKQYIDERQQTINTDSIISLERCLEKLTQIIEDPRSSKTEIMKAMDMRLKTLGAYTQNINANVNQININVDIEEDTNED